jgi:hypothetical protein
MGPFVVTNAVTMTNGPIKMVFPPLELQRMVVNGAKSSTAINGRVVSLGAGTSTVVLVAVAPEHAAVALDGQNNALALRK